MRLENWEWGGGAATYGALHEKRCHLGDFEGGKVAEGVLCCAYVRQETDWRFATE